MMYYTDVQQLTELTDPLHAPQVCATSQQAYKTDHVQPTDPYYPRRISAFFSEAHASDHVHTLQEYF